MSGKENLQHHNNKFRQNDGDIEGDSENLTPEEFELENDLFSCRCQVNSSADSSELRQPALKEEGENDPAEVNSLNMALKNSDKLFQELKQLDSQGRLTVNFTEDQLPAGILSRNKFIQELKKEIYRSRRYHSGLALILLAFVNAEELNSKSSMEDREKKIINLVEEIRVHIRKVDVFTRWDRDYFVIMYPDTELSLAIKLAKRLAENMATSVSDAGTKLSCRFGVTAVRPGEEYQELILRLRKIKGQLEKKKEINFYVTR